MKKRFIFVFMLTLVSTITIIGFQQEKKQLPNLGYFLTNAEALASGEQGGNEWESDKFYCRCKRENGTDVCLGGNAISTRPCCYKVDVKPNMPPVTCRNYSSNC